MINNINNGEPLSSVRAKLNAAISIVNFTETNLPNAITDIAYLQQNKQDKITSNLVAEIAGFGFSNNSINLLINIWNKDTNVTSGLQIPIPLVTDALPGLATAEMVNSINNLISRVMSIESGGILRGHFDTYADALAALPIANATQNDFVEILADETHDGNSTRYIIMIEDNQQSLSFAKVIDVPIQIATTAALGIVRSSNTNGKIYVETDGTMSLVGYDSLYNAVNELSTLLDAKANSQKYILLLDETAGVITSLPNATVEAIIKCNLTNASATRTIKINQTTPNIYNVAQFINNSATDKTVVLQKTANDFTNKYLVGNADNVDSVNGTVIIAVPANSIVEINYVVSVTGNTWECSIINNVEQKRV
jgi:hypothetical protein